MQALEATDPHGGGAQLASCKTFTGMLYGKSVLRFKKSDLSSPQPTPTFSPSIPESERQPSSARAAAADSARRRRRSTGRAKPLPQLLPRPLQGRCGRAPGSRAGPMTRVLEGLAAQGEGSPPPPTDPGRLESHHAAPRRSSWREPSGTVAGLALAEGSAAWRRAPRLGAGAAPRTHPQAPFRPASIPPASSARAGAGGLSPA